MRGRADVCFGGFLSDFTFILANFPEHIIRFLSEQIGFKRLKQRKG